MKLNSIIFPAPTCSYSLESEEFLIWIPTKKTLSTKISPSFLRPNHKKSSSFEIQTRLFSPKCFFAPKTKEISSIYKIKHKKSESNIYYPPENTSTPLTSSQKSFVMSKNNLKNYILSKKPNILNNNKSNSNSSDVSNSNFFSTSNKKKILSVHMNLKYQSNNSFFTDKSENKKKPNQKLQNYNNDEYNISKQNITKSKHLKQNFINANSFYQNKSEAQTQRNQELWNYADSINNSEIRKSKSINMRDLNEKNYKENYNTSNKIELKSQDFKQIFFNPSQLLGEEKQNSDFVERNFLGLVINNSKKNFSEGLLKLKSPLKKNRKIPCFLFQYPFGSSIILLHFHGNAEDIGDSLKYMKKLSNTLKVKKKTII